MSARTCVGELIRSARSVTPCSQGLRKRLGRGYCNIPRTPLPATSRQPSGAAKGSASRPPPYGCPPPGPSSWHTKCPGALLVLVDSVSPGTTSIGAIGEGSRRGDTPPGIGGDDLADPRHPRDLVAVRRSSPCSMHRASWSASSLALRPCWVCASHWQERSHLSIWLGPLDLDGRVEGRSRRALSGGGGNPKVPAAGPEPTKKGRCPSGSTGSPDSAREGHSGPVWRSAPSTRRMSSWVLPQR